MNRARRLTLQNAKCKLQSRRRGGRVAFKAGSSLRPLGSTRTGYRCFVRPEVSFLALPSYPFVPTKHIGKKGKKLSIAGTIFAQGTGWKVAKVLAGNADKWGGTRSVSANVLVKCF